MMVDRVKCRLADVCSSIDYGYTASATIKPTGVKFLRITDIVGFGLNWNTVPYVSADLKKLNRYVLNDQDMLIFTEN